MFWKKTSNEISNKIICEFADAIVEKVKNNILDDSVAMATRSMNDVLSAHDSIDRLKREKAALEEEVAKLKSKARLEEAEFKGLIKLREDRLSLDLEKKSVALEKDFNKKEMDLLKKGHEQHVKAIDEQSARLDKFMKEAMDCLKSATAKPATTTVVK